MSGKLKTGDRPAIDFLRGADLMYLFTILTLPHGGSQLGIQTVEVIASFAKKMVAAAFGVEAARAVP